MSDSSKSGRRRPAALVPILAAVWIASCSDSPSEPTDAAAVVEIEPGLVELELGATATLVATARDAAGNAVAGGSVVWIASDASIVQVDQTGRVTAVAAGSATIRADVAGRSGEASVTVVPWSIAQNAVVVDSTVLRLVSDEAELAAGTYRFDRLGNTAPSIAAGAVIVGAQGGGFLRRVTGAAAAGSTVTLETTPASLVDVVRHGSFETTIDLTGAPPSLVPGATPAAGEVLWGPVQIVSALDGVSLNSVGLDLSGIDFCEDVLSGCPSAIKEFKLSSGLIGFDPSLEIGATIENSELTEFTGIASGNLDLDFTVALEAVQSIDFEHTTTLATVQRIFYAQVGVLPVVGIVKFDVVAGFEAKATVKGRIEGGFENRHVVNVGGRYHKDTGWEGVLDGTRSFDAHQPSLSDSTLVGQIELEAEVSITPELRIIFYGVAGPFMNVKPWAKASLSFGTSSCGIKSSAGIDSTIGFAIAMLDPDVGTFSHTFNPYMWPGLDWECPLGHLDVATITNGQNPDADGYRIVVDGQDKGPVASTGSSQIQWVRVGTRSVELSGIAGNCQVEGDNPRQIDVPIALAIPVDFTVNCGSGLDLTGTWVLTVSGVCTGLLFITQSGVDFTVSGSVGGAACPYVASGSGSGKLNGNQITFGIAFGSGSGSGGGGSGSVTFDGTVVSSGTYMWGSSSGGSWTASRQ